ncbi:hypothetical protein HK103_003463 [Boothiomyces macroporosus]|uniref:Uncharacterized protein n=1 Tax=Boothiomyces macroporosus TaxID=261099 RepID=A0AAD5UHZ5_9FUNG|nr:hypothetical protein HK103_003463 [Boothiomyces macroporosus]
MFLNTIGALLLATAANAQTHNITVVISADNLWTLNMPSGNSFIPIKGPLDGNGANYAWKQISTYTQSVNGNGPWLVSVQTYNEGNIAGFFSAVYLDGKPYTATGIAGSLWKGTQGECNPLWSTASYDDSNWQPASTPCTSAQESIWGNGYMNQIWQATPGLQTRGVWLPDCTATNAYPNNQWRLKVALPVAANTPVNNAVKSSAVPSSTSLIATQVTSAVQSSTAPAQTAVPSSNPLIGTNKDGKQCRKRSF